MNDLDETTFDRVATVGLAVIGSSKAPTPSPSAVAVSLPPDSAPAADVVEAFLQALQAGDCATARALSILLVDGPSWADLCRLTHVTSHSVTAGPIPIDRDNVRFTGTMIITGIGEAFPAGEVFWTYFLERQASGSWRIVNGGIQLATVFPTDGPQAHPVLGGNYWMITELDGVAVTGFAELGINKRGAASGNIQFDCGFLLFDYTYDVTGSSISFTVDPEHSSTEGCTDAQVALYYAVQAALPRIAAWRSAQPEHLEFLDAGGAIALKAGPLPPLPTAPPVGDCGEVPLADCERAATLAFNFDLFPEPGQTVVSWRVRPTIYSGGCSSPGDPKYDVIFQLANPAGEWIATVAEFDGKLHACGSY